MKSILPAFFLYFGSLRNSGKQFVIAYTRAAPASLTKAYDDVIDIRFTIRMFPLLDFFIFEPKRLLWAYNIG
ncbi:MAG: hypothetical protein H6Q14_2860 [Bacteroidetes bacterium]|nr:hypothetical protein [Bacteroidota bacterium]